MQQVHVKESEEPLDRYDTLADALEQEVLTEMAGTFFGARKELDDRIEAFRLLVEALRQRAAKVYARVFFLRSLVLGARGEDELFAALQLPPQFPEAREQSGSRLWKPAHLPFALFPSARYVKTVQLAYAELRRACDVYMRGEYEDDPEHKGRKRLSVNYAMAEAECRDINARIDKLNAEMTPSSVLQYARSISMEEQPGQGAITNVLGADSLDKGLTYPGIDFASLKLWRAPDLPDPEAAEPRLAAFAKAFYAAHASRVRAVLEEL